VLGVGLPYLFMGISNLINLIVNNRRARFFGSNPAEAMQLRKQQLIRM
jgi:hypothetical protein